MGRQTLQKSLIINALSALYHPTADDIYSHIVLKYPHISKGTVYRNLAQMVQDGRILQVKIPAGADHFDHTIQDHYHGLCTKCGGIFDMDMPYKNDLNTFKSASGFVTKAHSLLFTGLCADCHHNLRKENKK